jgi:hypothetical protein
VAPLGMAEEQITVDNIRAAGNITIYKQGDLWKAEDVLDIDPTKDADQIVVVKLYSDEYDKLVAANNEDENQILSSQQNGEKYLLKLRGQIYLIE